MKNLKSTISYLTFQPSIVLVHPQLDLNIGATARAMANFGLTDLKIVSTEITKISDDCIRIARNGAYVLHNITHYPSLEKALADTNFSLCTTARNRDINIPVYSPQHGVKEILQHSNKKSSCSIVFGPEKSGLTNQHIEQTNGIIEINTNKECQSINLSHAIAIVCYELSINRYSYSSKTVSQKSELAKNEDILYLVQEIKQILKYNRYHTHRNHQLLEQNLNIIIKRAQLTSNETRFIRGILSNIKKNI